MSQITQTGFVRLWRRFGVVDYVCRQNRRRRILGLLFLGHLPQQKCLIDRRQPFYGHQAMIRPKCRQTSARACCPEAFGLWTVTSGFVIRTSPRTSVDFFSGHV